MEISERAAIIPCAGQAKRMGKIDVPKSLVEIKGKPALLHLLETLNCSFDIFYIPINIKHKDHYLSCLPKNLLKKINLIDSEPGSGDGQAVLDALNAIDLKKIRNEIMVCWGDTVLQRDSLINKLLTLKFSEPLLIPVYLTKDPYVTYLENDLGIPERVAFKRRGEMLDEGKTDISLFLIKAKEIKKTLTELKNNKLKNNTISNINTELNFLDIVEHLYSINNPARTFEIDFYEDVYSFNTMEELGNISNKLN
tara:strand:+ start:56675 stop:57433 length:759 start_codon:yes stop_codon:yes gene_type:complete